MVSIAAQIHAQQAAGGGRRPVVVYSPGRRVGPQPAPTRRTTAPSRPVGAVNWAEVENAFASTKGAKEKAQKTAQKEAEDAAWDDTPWYKKGLGVVLGNPIVSNVLKPLSVLGVPGKAVTLAFEEIVEGLGLTDDELTAGDKRSNWEKLAPTSDYGVGQLLDPDNPAWLNKLGGFVGDVAFDPFTYFTGGATRLAGAPARMAKLGKAASALENVEDVTSKLARLENVTDEFGIAEHLRTTLTKQADEQAALARRLGVEAEAIPLGKRVPLRQGRKARESFLGEIAEANPALLREHGAALTRGAERGFNTIRDPALREALGLGDPAIRFMGKNIPRTERLIYPYAKAGGAVRRGMNKAPLLGKGMEAFASKGTEEASKILSRGAGGDPLRAATLIRVKDLMRRGAGNFEGRGNKELTALVRSWKNLSDNEIRSMFRAAELDGAPNNINKFFKNMSSIYEKVAGMPMGTSRNPDTYVPHMMTPQFRRWLAAHLDDKTVDEFMKANKFVKDDLLEGSKYLEKSRKLQPSAPGTPTDFKIGDRTITLTDGSIDELNEQLAHAFGDKFSGKAYMDDPVKIGEAYINSVARQAGRDYAMKQMASSDNPLVKEIAGEILGAVNLRNEWSRRNPVTELIKKGYTKGQRLSPVQGKGDMPTTPYDELFGVTRHTAETNAQTDLLMKEGKKFVQEVGADVTARRSTIVDNLKALRKTLSGGLKKKAKDADEQIGHLNRQLNRMDDEIKKLGPLTTENVDEIVAVQHTIEQQIVDTKKEIKKIQDHYGKKIPRDQKRLERELQATLRQLDEQKKRIEATYDNGSAAMRAEARQRKEMLERPVYEAQEKLDQAEAKLPPRPVSNQRVREANARIRQGFETEDAYEAERSRFLAALHYMRENDIPINRRIDGRLTDETAETVQQIVADTHIAEAALPIPADVLDALPPAQRKVVIGAQMSVDNWQRQLDALPEGNARRAAIETEIATAQQKLDEVTAEIMPPAPEPDADLLPEPEVPEVAAAPEELTDEQISELLGAMKPPEPSTKLVRDKISGDYVSEDGFVITKAGHKQWVVLFTDEDGNVLQDLGVHSTLPLAKSEVETAQYGLGRGPLRDKEAVEAVAAGPPPAAAAVTEPAAPAAVIEEAAPPVKAAKPRKPKKRWSKRNELGRDIEVHGPSGWQIEPFEESLRTRPLPGEFQLPKGVKGPTREVGDVGLPQGPLRTKYVAVNPDAEKDVLRGRSFWTKEEAKLAVEEVLDKPPMTMEERIALSEMRPGGPPVEAYASQISNQVARPAVMPEEAAARAALGEIPDPARNLDRIPRQRATVQPEAFGTMTPEGETLLALKAQVGPHTNPYWDAYTAWQRELKRAQNMALPKEMRDASARKARSMGGEFLQTGGKFYNDHAAAKIITEDIEWQRVRETDPAVMAAQAEYDKAVVQADQQVEAMVYIKHNDPIKGISDAQATGTPYFNQSGDIYTRAPDASVGFAEGQERIPVPVEVPTQGAAPVGTRLPLAEPEAGPTISRGDLAHERALLDQPDTTILGDVAPPAQAAMMPDNVARYDVLTERSDDIQRRVTLADQNQARIDELDEAAKAAYTSEVKAADAAVAEAKAAELRVKPHADSLPGAQTAYQEAKRRTQAAVDNQTQVRQQWMEADRAWRAALAERDEYLALEADVSRLEHALLAQGEQGKDIIAATRSELPGYEGLAPPETTRLMPAKMGERSRRLARDLRERLIMLDAAKEAGMEFITDTERRRLQGILNDIDVEKRSLARRSGTEVRPGPSRPPVVEVEKAVAPPGPIPQVWGTGQEPLAARAYAESFEPLRPSVGDRWQLDEEGVPQLVSKTGKPEPYTPRTEREAIGELQEQAGVKSPEQLREEENVAQQVIAEKQRTAETKVETELLQRAKKDEALLPLRDRIETYNEVDKALNRKAELIPERAEAQLQKAQIDATKVGQSADLIETIDTIEMVARQNPKLLDDDLATTEGVLQAGRKEAEALAETDLTRKQVQEQIDKVGDKKDKSLDIMLTTVGQNWRMLYEANGTKKAVLKEGDLIVERELHKMFSNLYELQNDRVLFGRTLNAFTNLFKTYATLTPGFHIRNAISAIFMNTADGVPLKTQYKAAGLWREYAKAPDGEAWIAKQTQEIQDAFTAAYATGVGGRFTESGFAEVMNEGGWMDKLERLQRNRFTRLSQRAGVRVEGSVRLAMAMDSMAIGESIEMATQRINRIHFDYGDISKLDENMKRLVPFWTFMSRNMPMQVSQMWTHPRTYLNYEYFVRNMSSVNEEYTPEYWTKAGAFNSGLKVPNVPGLGGAQGLPVYLAPDLGFTRLESDLKDYEDFLSGKRPGGVLSQVNPLLSAPVEYVTRQDIFTGQRFEEGETVPVGGPLGFPYKMLAKVVGQEEGGEVDAAFMNAIRAINPLTDRTTRLAPQLTGGDEEGKKRQLESWLRTMLGAPVRTLTPKQQDNEYYRQYYDELDALKRQQERLSRQAS